MNTIKSLAIALVAAMGLSSCGYNTMVEKQEAVDAQWAQVENVYQRRADLIPNLVATVKGYAKHESETLSAVVEARSKATSVTIDASSLSEENLAKFQQAQGELSGALSRLLAVQEAYPDLKANENFRDLSAQLEGTENTYIKKFPQNLMAGIFSFDSKPYFKADEGAEKAPKVEF